jgi:hypothetical protein
MGQGKIQIPRKFSENSQTRQEILSANSANKEALEKVQSSVFTVCLDDSQPTTLEEVKEFSRNFLIFGDRAWSVARRWAQ